MSDYAKSFVLSMWTSPALPRPAAFRLSAYHLLQLWGDFAGSKDRVISEDNAEAPGKLSPHCYPVSITGRLCSLYIPTLLPSGAQPEAHGLDTSKIFIFVSTSVKILNNGKHNMCLDFRRFTGLLFLSSELSWTWLGKRGFLFLTRET